MVLGDPRARSTVDAPRSARPDTAQVLLGMVIGTATGLHNAATVVLPIALAFVFGYVLTMRGVLRAGLPVRQALKVAPAADTTSIAVMELIDNTIMGGVPGAMEAGLSQPLFRASLAASLAVAFVLTTPVNRWMIGCGKGHAIIHAFTDSTTATSTAAGPRAGVPPVVFACAPSGKPDRYRGPHARSRRARRPL
ncbi:hypothetical protein SFUMM280S_09645 [Streptomyces fumanus]